MANPWLGLVSVTIAPLKNWTTTHSPHCNCSPSAFAFAIFHMVACRTSWSWLATIKDTAVAELPDQPCHEDHQWVQPFSGHFRRSHSPPPPILEHVWVLWWCKECLMNPSLQTFIWRFYCLIQQSKHTLCCSKMLMFLLVLFLLLFSNLNCMGFLFQHMLSSEESTLTKN